MTLANDRLRVVAWCALSAVLLVLLSIVDYATGPELAFGLYYLLIIALLAWKTGHQWIAMGAAAATSVVWLGAEWLTLGAPHELILMLNGASRLVTLVCVAWLVCRLRTARDSERAVARTDFVTGALNARAFHELAGVEVERARRYGHPLAVAYLDLDDFKAINDSLGHSQGNNVLRGVAATLRTALRASDYVARVGGDEFLVLLPETGYWRARQTVARLQTALRSAMAENQWPVTFSIGVAVFDAPAGDVDTLIRTADEMMYLAKHSGKNRFRIAARGAAVRGHVPQRSRAAS